MEDKKLVTYTIPIAIAIAILVYASYVFWIWYPNRDYLANTRQELIQVYSEPPMPKEPIEQWYGLKKGLLTFYIVGHKKYDDLKETYVVDFYQEMLQKEGWKIVEKEVIESSGNKIYGISARKGEFSLSLSSIENTGKWRYSLIKKDWIYEKGF